MGSWFQKKRHIIKKYINNPLVALAAWLIISVSISAFAEDSYYLVKRVVDGDTVKLSDGTRVRLIGVDTPEVHDSAKLVMDARKQNMKMWEIKKLGRKASEFTRKLCLNKRVRLELDIEKNDDYGRLLAYVYLEDGTFVNARIIEEGYGRTITIPPNVKYSKYFLSLEKEAKDKKKGLRQDDRRN